MVIKNLQDENARLRVKSENVKTELSYWNQIICSGYYRKQIRTQSFRGMKFLYGYQKIRKKLKTQPRKLNFDFLFCIYETYLFVKGLFKVSQYSSPDSMLLKPHQKAKFRLFRHVTIWFSKWEKEDKNSDFTERSSFLASNILKLHIF